MISISYKNISYRCEEGESVLQTFLRNGVDIPFSCKSGICQLCLMRAISGAVPEIATTGLKQNLIDKHYFKACSCIPSENLVVVSDPVRDDILITAVIAKKEYISSDICRLLIEPEKELHYHPGQFINIQRKDGVKRSYSLSSVPNEDYFLDIYVKKVANGDFSPWIFDVLSENDEIELSGPNGNSYYSPGNSQQPMLLIGTGTGISPLYGIVRDALLSKHEGGIYLYHGSHTPEGLFLHKKLTVLQEQYSNFYYIACVSGEHHSNQYISGRANELALLQHPDLTGWAVFLCGQPDMVNITQARAIKAGVDLPHIKTDPFWLSEDLEKTERRHYPEPDPQMWQALEQGTLLMKALQCLYDKIYKDPRLSSFFEGTSKQRSIEKQYSFLYQVFTGEKVYFGDRPRNAHHWMVISDELFDYRQKLVAECLRFYGLEEEFIKRWFAMEDEYRAEIVKDKPWNLIKFGKEIPLEGFEELIMDSATLCDNCQAEVNVGDVVRYHVRIGKIYCQKCMHS